MLKFKRLIFFSLFLVSTSGFAKTSLDDLLLLHQTHTKTGALITGNNNEAYPEQNIPPLIHGFPDNLHAASYHKSGDTQPWLYANEEPILRIHRNNLDLYKDSLSQGMIALIRKYPDRAFMDIYPSHRHTRYSDSIESASVGNTLNAALDFDGSLLVTYPGIPFPFPENGLEIIWNHIHRVSYPATRSRFHRVAVFQDGSNAFQTYEELTLSPKYASTVEDNNVTGLQYVLETIQSPARKKGEIILIQDHLPFLERRAWQYLPGTRRVRRAPTLAYDFPSGPGGLRTFDDRRGFNGATDRFDWVILGRQEMFIPYHNYAMDSPALGYNDFIQAGYPVADFIRYERHRVWVVEGKLKADKRHIYSKRRFYIDEDSWNIVLAENYDGRGRLWRVQQILSIHAFDLPGIISRVEISHDLEKDSYLMDRLINEASGPPVKLDPLPDERTFTTSYVRKLGGGGSGEIAYPEQEPRIVDPLPYEFIDTPLTEEIEETQDNEEPLSETKLSCEPYCDTDYQWRGENLNKPAEKVTSEPAPAVAEAIPDKKEEKPLMLYALNVAGIVVLLYLVFIGLAWFFHPNRRKNKN